jgi:hypothetical protein
MVATTANLTNNADWCETWFNDAFVNDNCTAWENEFAYHTQLFQNYTAQLLLRDSLTNATDNSTDSDSNLPLPEEIIIGPINETSENETEWNNSSNSNDTVEEPDEEKGNDNWNETYVDGNANETETDNWNSTDVDGNANETDSENWNSTDVDNNANETNSENWNSTDVDGNANETDSEDLNSTNVDGNANETETDNWNSTDIDDNANETDSNNDWNSTNNETALDWNETNSNETENWNETDNWNETENWNETDNWNNSQESNNTNSTQNDDDEEDWEGDYIDVSIAGFKFEASQDYKSKLVEMRAKFREYFDWALVHANGDATEELGTCSEECAIDEQKNMCCATVKMSESKDTTRFVQHQCMNAAVVEISSGLWINDFYFEYQCQEGDWKDGKKSSAASLALGVASFLLAVSFV